MPKEGGKGGKGVEGRKRGGSPLSTGVALTGVTFESTGVPQKVGKLTMGGEGGEGVYNQQVPVTIVL